MGLRNPVLDVPTRKVSWNPAGVEPVHWKPVDVDPGTLIIGPN